MSTTRSFSNMLNVYAPNKLFREEAIKRDFWLNKAEKDDSWLGGELLVPFHAGRASTVKLGGLTASGEIGKSKFVKGSITTQPELWGSLIFNERDIMEHGKVSEQNFVRLLPDEIEGFLEYIKQVLSHSFSNGAYFAKATGNGDSSGNIVVDRPERFEPNQKVIIDDDNSGEATGYVSDSSGINMETGNIKFVTALGGSTALDLTNYTSAQNAKFYFDGAAPSTSSNRFSSLKDMLLSVANGGSTNLYGQAKLASPYTQAINIAGSTITSTNFLEKLFDALVVMRNRAKGKANTFACSYKHWASAMKILQAEKGAFRQASEAKASQYGWDEVEIAGPQGSMTLVGIQEMDDDWIPLMDMSAIKIYSNGFIKKRRSPEGQEYFVIRGEDGYQYIVDICFFGDMVLEKPSRCGILHGISY